MSNFTILSTGSYIPEKVLDNKMLEKMVDTTDEWIMKRVGINERRVSSGEPTWYMAKEAARKALEDSGLKPDEIDLVIVSSITPDYYFPSTATIIQDELKLVNAGCFDIAAACTGFIYALDIAEKYLYSDKYTNILIVSSEILSKVVDYTDRSSCVLFGDGAGAAVISKNGNGKMLSSFILSDGEGGKRITAKALPVDTPFAEKDIVEKYDRFPDTQTKYFRQDGKEVFKFATKAMYESCVRVMDEANLTIDDIDFIIPHQANVRIIDYAVKKLGIDSSKVAYTIKKFGNASSACIPMAFDLWVREGKIKRGDKVIFTGFGSGLTYGAALVVF